MSNGLVIREMGDGWMDRQKDGQTDGEMSRETDRLTYTDALRQTDEQTDTNRWTKVHRIAKGVRPYRKTGEQIDSQSHKVSGNDIEQILQILTNVKHV
jgi:hypothetical protein